jgi:putative PIG3 family NAD(P)H quinone oxidoreductase
MRFVAITHPGPPDVLAIQEGPTPSPVAGEVVIRVAAAGVNRADVMQRQRKYPPPPGASPILGLEVAGTVAAADVDSLLRIGDPVCALLSGGGYAEYVAVPAVQCLPIPAGLTAVEAAALPETFFTVWSNVFQRGRLQAGEALLVHGGSSGIGTTAISLGKAFGARVAVTAGTEEKCAACRRLGADLAVNYRTGDFVAPVKDFTGGRGADVVLDMVGAAYLERNVDLLAVDGRLILIALQQGSRAEVDLSRVLQKRLTITGSTLRSRPAAEKGAIARDLERNVWPLIADGKLRPQIHATFPLGDAAQAHALMESSAHIGKIVLVV